MEDNKETIHNKHNAVKKVSDRVGLATNYLTHNKIHEVEKENSAVEASHKAEEKVEDIYRYVKRYRKNKRQRQQKKAIKLEKKQLKATVDFQYQKFLEDNPQMKGQSLKKQIQKRIQKQRIKRQYAKAYQKKQHIEQLQGASVTVADTTTKVVKKLQETVTKHSAFLVSVGTVTLILVMMMAMICSCGAILSDSVSIVLAGSYRSVPKEIDEVDLMLSKLEMELQKEIHTIETDYPHYDEYSYHLADVRHNPFVLISYLSAVYSEFTASSVELEVESLFDEMYELTLTPTEETRTRMVTKLGVRTVTKTEIQIFIDPVTGEEIEQEYEYEVEEEYEYEEEEQYTVSVLEVKLTATDLDVVVDSRMNEEQKEMYHFYSETHGLIQQFDTPLDLYWYDFVSSYYGYRYNPISGVEELHRGIDIAVPMGTTIYAGMDGTVVTATYHEDYGNYVVIENSKGYMTKYAYLDSFDVCVGQNVVAGDVLGTTGSSSYLHIECLYQGIYYNPLFYFECRQTISHEGCVEH